MNDGLGLEIFDDVAEEFVVADIANVGFDGAAGEAVPDAKASPPRTAIFILPPRAVPTSV
jgi:hypothetical protein